MTLADELQRAGLSEGQIAALLIMVANMRAEAYDEGFVRGRQLLAETIGELLESVTPQASTVTA